MSRNKRLMLIFLFQLFAAFIIFMIVKGRHLEFGNITSNQFLCYGGMMFLYASGITIYHALFNTPKESA